LQHEITEAGDIRMGVAYIEGIENCLAFTKQEVKKEDLKLFHSNQNEREAELFDALESYIGKECSICADMCPYPDKTDAIEMIYKNGKIFPKINEKCVGCGVCAELCPVSIISVAPRKTYEEVYA
jgi:ferredoxin-type protein NapG